ncbi:hypothetical protein SSX86_032096 [Deinandra increscens subsp. villosa]|uniref:RRM domain-containing protein n=1 Tax=Deinandra increscens subsp. villosa TaxID=3103831 RepID=A0AAP0C4N5_9ASTR
MFIASNKSTERSVIKIHYHRLLKTFEPLNQIHKTSSHPLLWFRLKSSPASGNPAADHHRTLSTSLPPSNYRCTADRDQGKQHIGASVFDSELRIRKEIGGVWKAIVGVNSRLGKLNLGMHRWMDFIDGCWKWVGNGALAFSAKEATRRVGKRFVTGEWGRLTFSFFVSGFPDDTTAGILWKAAQHLGTLEDSYIPRKRRYNNECYGFIRYKDVGDVEIMVKQLNEIKIKGQKVNTNFT